MMRKTPPGINPAQSELYDALLENEPDRLVPNHIVLAELERLLNEIDKLSAEAYRKSGQ